MSVRSRSATNNKPVVPHFPVPRVYRRTAEGRRADKFGARQRIVRM